MFAFSLLPLLRKPGCSFSFLNAMILKMKPVIQKAKPIKLYSPIIKMAAIISRPVNEKIKLNNTNRFVLFCV